MMNGIIKSNELKNGKKVMSKKALYAVLGASVAVSAATIIVLDSLVKKKKASEK